jgi:hypothetical protein
MDHDDDFDSPYSCPMCGCEEVRWAAPMGVACVACSCRACGWEYLITQEVTDGCV